MDKAENTFHANAIAPVLLTVEASEAGPALGASEGPALSVVEGKQYRAELCLLDRRLPLHIPPWTSRWLNKQALPPQEYLGSGLFWLRSDEAGRVSKGSLQGFFLQPQPQELRCLGVLRMVDVETGLLDVSILPNLRGSLKYSFWLRLRAPQEVLAALPAVGQGVRILGQLTPEGYLEAREVSAVPLPPTRPKEKAPGAQAPAPSAQQAKTPSEPKARTLPGKQQAPQPTGGAKPPKPQPPKSPPPKPQPPKPPAKATRSQQNNPSRTRVWRKDG